MHGWTNCFRWTILVVVERVVITISLLEGPGLSLLLEASLSLTPRKEDQPGYFYAYQKGHVGECYFQIQK